MSCGVRFHPLASIPVPMAPFEQWRHCRERARPFIDSRRAGRPLARTTRRETHRGRIRRLPVSLLWPGVSDRGAVALGILRFHATYLSQPSSCRRASARRGSGRDGEAVGLQGKFWEIHEALYENQKDLSDAALSRYAEQVGADVTRAMSDVAGGAPRQRVESDFEGAIRSGANGTPTFFVNGVRYDGSWMYEPFSEYLEQVRGGPRGF